MAITAKFIADFSSFTDAVDAAETTLTGFQGNAGKVETALNKMVANFSGVRVVQEATLMSEALQRMRDEGITPTADALELAGNKAAAAADKLRALGQDVPPELDALANSVKEQPSLWDAITGRIGEFAAGLVTADAIVGVAKGIFDTLVSSVEALGQAFFESAGKTAALGASISDQSLKTGIAVPALTKLGQAAQIAGGSLDEIGNAMFQFEQRTETSSAKVADGLGKIGLSLAALKQESPDQQFIDIANALAKMEDPMDRNAAAFELFGRQARDLMPLMLDLNGAMERTAGLSVFTDEEARQAKDYAMDVEALKLQFEDLQIVIGKTLIPLFSEALPLVKGSIGWFLLNGAVVAKEFQIGLEQAFPSLALAPAAAKAVIANPDLGASQDEEARAAVDVAQQIKAMAAAATLDPKLAAGWFQFDAALKDIDTSTAEGKKQMAALQAQMKTLDDQAQISIASHKAAAAAAKAAAAEYAKWNDAVTGLQDVLNSSMWDGSIQGALKLGASVKDLAIYFGTSEAEIIRNQKEMKVWAEVVGVEAPRNLDALQKQLGTLGGAIPEKFFTDTAKVMDSLQKIESGAKLSVSALGGMGAAAKPAMNDLNATFGTIGLNFDEMEKVSIGGLQHTADIADQTYRFMRDHAEMFTSETITHFHQLAIAADAAAGDIGAKFTQALTGAETEMANTLDAALTGGDVGAAGTKLVENFATSLVKGIPIIGDAMSKFVAPIVDGIKKIFGGPSADELAARQTFADFQKQFGTLQQTITAVGAAYAQVGKTGVQAQHDLQAALDATHQSAAAEADALKTINDVMASQQQDQADLTAAVQKYGFTIQELGPAMQKQQLDQQATTLLNDWRLLVGAGIDLSTVNEHMAGSINDYLKLARDTGQEVPEAMEPILQKMIDAGELTDDAGNKITDLKDTGVTFSESMTEGFQKVVDKLTDLINKIPDLAASFANIPGINIPVTYTVTNAPPGVPAIPPSHASTGGEVTMAGVVAFAGGGAVGTDTVPAILTPGEVVLNDAQQKTLLGLAQGGSSAQWREMAGEIRQLREEQAAQGAQQRRLPNQLAAAITSALLQAKIGRR